MTVRGTTAEWHCTHCATTNRKLVPSDTVEVRDRCVHCKTKHVIAPATRSSWKASAA
jgi:hypothetical protein